MYRADKLLSLTSRCFSSLSSSLRIGPTARNLIGHYGLEETAIPATGPKNVLLKEDVLKYIETNRLTPKSHITSQTSVKTQATPQTSRAAPAVHRRAKGPKFIDKEITNIRRVIAKRLTEAKKTIPHGYITAVCDVSSLNTRRKEMAKSGVKVSMNDFIIKACGVCLKKNPLMNVTWDSSKEMVVKLSAVDISIAVATPTGLITPIIKDANCLSVPQISNVVKELADRARIGKLQPHEFQGGSFSISNLGMFGIKEFKAVINPPQAGILAVGRGFPSVIEKREDMHMTLSYDVRAVDEEVASVFVEELVELLSNVSALDREGDGSGHRRLSSLLE